MDITDIEMHLGLAEKYRLAAVELYDEAFGDKFAVAIPCREKRLKFLQTCFSLEYVIAAIYQNKLLGIAGFQTPSGSLTSGINYQTLLSELGIIRGHWAALIFDLYDRKALADELIMDGIAVHADARGKGIGSCLLKEVANYAKQNHFKQVRLDVIDINDKAKSLYERMGFKAIKTESYPYLKFLLGFSGSTTMALRL